MHCNKLERGKENMARDSPQKISENLKELTAVNLNGIGDKVTQK
jgi:hypothetical protein